MTEMNGQGRFGVRQYVPTSTNPLWNNLIHYYSGDSTANDLKGNAHATLVNGTTYATGLINNGFNFDGINDYASTPPLNYTSGDITISFYMSPNWINNIQGFIESKNFYTNTNQFSINYYMGGNSLRFISTDNLTTVDYFDYNTWDYSTWTNSIKVGQYYHMVLQYIESARTIKLYVNRELKFTNTLSVGKTLNIADGLVFNSKQFPFGGKLDDIAIWNRAITYKEITELYNGGTPYSSLTLSGKQYSVTENYVAPSAEQPAVAVTTGLIMNLDAGNFDSYPGVGTTWTDLTGNGNNGTLVNGTGYNSTNGGTMVFDGINDYVSVTGINRTSLGSTFTLSLWYNKETTPSGGIFEISPTPNSGGPFILLQQNSASLSWYLNNGYCITVPVSINTWNNVVLTYSSNQYKTYINGVLSGSYSGGLSGNSGSLLIGSGYPTVSKEKVATFQAYNKALTQAEITANFNALKGRYGL